MAAQNSWGLHTLASLCGLLLLLHKANAVEFKVGGTGAWGPNFNETFYNKWAEGTRFQINDAIVFNYEAHKDSVLLVSKKEDYKSCTTTGDVLKYSDESGQTKVQFDRSGYFYFISGVNCNTTHQKLVIVVLADRRSRSNAPTPTPSSSSAPAPAPAAQAAPPSPPPAAVDLTPAPEPAAQDSPNTNAGGSLIVTGCASSMIAAAALSFMLF
ncbi:unnamed protein product [Cuscuta europaea]|uniref:Phytocyanin domain-containing protein n=1 Tax=Cuscuta europaea TaxID=41803 RepID=A0A9P0YUD2_CUSEU|nr:unnamed protein product [Cuscuta europaea]